MPRRVSSPIFVGRVAERAAISEALERAAAGRPGTVLIAGEAGVGKSRLLAETVTRSAALSMDVVTGACVDVAAGTLPFGPFIDIARGLHRTGRLAGLPRTAAMELGRLVPEIATAGSTAAAGDAALEGLRAIRERADEGAQGRLFAAFRDALGLASAASPMVVAIEDLHWADATTLDLVSYLARSLQGERLLLIATARLDALPRRHALLGVVAELSRLPSMERIDLARFDEREVAQQLTGILGQVPAPELSRDVFERSDGNAFFAEELIATGAAGGGPLPASLRDALGVRLASLDEPTQQVLRVAAVAGRDVPHDLLVQVAGMTPGKLLAGLRTALEQRVLVDVADPFPGYSFRHALMREAAYDDLLAAERAALHGAIADALERDAALSPGGPLGRAGEIAFHAMAAGDLARALTASLDAAAAAEHAAAFAEAELHLDRIVEIWPRIPDAEARVGTDRAGLLARLARAAASAGHQARAAAVARAGVEALPLDARDRRIAILLELFDYAAEGADIDAAEGAVVEAIGLLGEEHSARGAHAAAADALLQLHRGNTAHAAARASRGIEIARACGAHRELAMALTVRGQAQIQLGETNQAGASLAEAAGLFDDIGDPRLRARWLRWRGWAKYMHGEFEESLALQREALETARREGADARVGAVLLDGTLETLVELGRWEEAEAIARQIMARVSRSFEVVYSHMSLSRMYTFQGRFGEAEAEQAKGMAIPAVGPHRIWQLEDSIFLAYVRERAAAGRELMETAIAASPDPDTDATLWWSLGKAVGGEADRAGAARRRRRSAEAEEAVVAGRRFAAIFRASAERAIAVDGGGPAVAAALATVDAEESRLVGRTDPIAWGAAVAARARLDQPWELAYARYRHAEAVLEAGEPSGPAAAALRLAHQSAAELGARPLREAIEALAARARIQFHAGAGSDAGAPDGGAARRPATALEPSIALTAREAGVLALVAAGHTNREIGERLFISEKTVSVHVTNAMEKLGALSRYEAAAAATRLGLLDATGSAS